TGTGTGGTGGTGTVKARRSGIAWLASLFKVVLLRDRGRALLDRKPGRVLDIGCGNGDFLRFLKRRGWEVAGTDFSAEAAALARAKGIPVHRGDLASAAFPDRAFDVVTLWHVVEHLPHPHRELDEVERILRDDGLLVIEVPNSDCPTRRLCGTAWRQLDVPRHLQHFTPETLAAMLARSGFAVVRRQDFHAIDFDLVFYSVADRLGITRRTGIRYFSTDFRPASLRAKLAFLAFGLPIALLSLPYAAVATRLSGNGESLTVTCRKSRP
ncbi:MAG: class I SAM-dependent methyltransferase, partial [Chloroflexia bacterium]|nr:class I SAM-dependent methyltransferase [Chloroflexia bacterium]